MLGSTRQDEAQATNTSPTWSPRTRARRNCLACRYRLERGRYVPALGSHRISPGNLALATHSSRRCRLRNRWMRGGAAGKDRSRDRLGRRAFAVAHPREARPWPRYPEQPCLNRTRRPTAAVRRRAYWAARLRWPGRSRVGPGPSSPRRIQVAVPRRDLFGGLLQTTGFQHLQCRRTLTSSKLADSI